MTGLTQFAYRKKGYRTHTEEMQERLSMFKGNIANHDGGDEPGHFARVVYLAARVKVAHEFLLLGAEFVGRTVAILQKRGVDVFDVRADAEEAWCQKILDSFVDASPVKSRG